MMTKNGFIYLDSAFSDIPKVVKEFIDKSNDYLESANVLSNNRQIQLENISSLCGQFLLYFLDNIDNSPVKTFKEILKNFKERNFPFNQRELVDHFRNRFSNSNIIVEE